MINLDCAITPLWCCKIAQFCTFLTARWRLYRTWLGLATVKVSIKIFCPFTILSDLFIYLDSKYPEIRSIRYFLSCAMLNCATKQTFVTQDFSWDLELQVESEINKPEKLSNCTTIYYGKQEHNSQKNCLVLITKHKTFWTLWASKICTNRP